MYPCICMKLQASALIKEEPTCPGKHKKRKKKRKERNWTNCPCALAHGHFCPLSSPIFSFQFFLHFGEKTSRSLLPSLVRILITLGPLGVYLTCWSRMVITYSYCMDIGSVPSNGPLLLGWAQPSDTS